MARSRRTFVLSCALGGLIALSLAVYIPVADQASAYSSHARIAISGDAGFTVANGVVDGSGTEADPFVISGWDITGGGNKAIEVINTNAHFVISDCYIHNTGWYSVWLENAHNGTFTGNNVSSNTLGVAAVSCANLVVSNNTIWDTTYYGLDLMLCNGTVVTNNSISGSWFFGMVINDCIGLVLQDNAFINDGIEMWGDEPLEYNSHEIGPSNTVNGLPVLYYANLTDLVVDSEPVGELIMANCSNILATGLDISGPEVAILSAYCFNETISGCTIANASYSIRFWNSTDLEIRDNTILNAFNDHMRIVDPGMGIVGHYCEGIIIESNEIIDSDYGVFFGYVSDVTFRENTVTLGGYAVAFGAYCATDVVIQRNNLSDKDGSVMLADSVNCTVVDNRMYRNNNDAFLAFSVTGMLLENNSLVDNGFGMRMSEIYDAVISDNLVTGAGGYINSGTCGIDITTGAQIAVTNNTVTSLPEGGVMMDGIDGVTLSGNVLSSNFNDGVAVFNSKDVRILNNSIELNGGDGLFEVGGSGIFEIMGNSISNNADSGVLITHGAEIVRNTIANNDWYGIGLNSSGSLIHHNNIIGNVIPAYDDSFTGNQWDNGYPDGGNYWSGYAGVDLMNGPSQDVPGSDGIGDTPRVVPFGRADRYPLMEQFELNRPPVASFEVTPVSGDTSTTFEFNASGSWDHETPGVELMFRWDWDGDGTWDTDWSNESTVTHQFAASGNNTVRLEVRDGNNTTGEYSLQVEVVEVIPELPALMAPALAAALCLLVLAYASSARRRFRKGPT